MGSSSVITAIAWRSEGDCARSLRSGGLIAVRRIIRQFGDLPDIYEDEKSLPSGRQGCNGAPASTIGEKSRNGEAFWSISWNSGAEIALDGFRLCGASMLGSGIGTLLYGSFLFFFVRWMLPESLRSVFDRKGEP